MSSERHSEEFVLRELFRNFDRDSNGKLTLTELKGVLLKMDLTANEDIMQALLNKIDINKNGLIEFEEFVHFVINDRYHKV